MHPFVVLATVVAVDPHVLRGAGHVAALGLWVVTRPFKWALGGWSVPLVSAVRAVREASRGGEGKVSGRKTKLLRELFHTKRILIFFINREYLLLLVTNNN